jgi:hypothetical protein
LKIDGLESLEEKDFEVLISTTRSTRDIKSKTRTSWRQFGRFLFLLARSTRLFNQLETQLDMYKHYVIIIISLIAGFGCFSIYYDEYQKMEIRDVYAFSKSETPCNCTLDSVDNMPGFELPKVELLQSKNEIPLEWTESKEIGLDGVLVGNTYIANYSAGNLVEQSTIEVGQNRLLGLEISDGKFPDIVSGEIVSSTTPMNSTDLQLGELVIDKKISDSYILFDKSLEEPTLEQNSFMVQVPPQGGNFVLILSLLYNYNPNIGINNNNGSGAAPVQTQPSSSFIAIYKSIVSVDPQM